MYCPKCGTGNPDGGELCISCGLVLSSAVIEEQSGEVKTSGMAIASLVLGISSIFTCFLTSLPAIILGIISLVKISNSKGRLKGMGLAIAGIATPVVLLPIVGLLIMMPALSMTRAMAYRMLCHANMQGLGHAMIIYAADNDDMYPSGSQWCDLLIEHCDVNADKFQCKVAVNGGRCNYAMNKNIEELGKNAPPDMVLLFESEPGWNQVGGPEILTTENHQGRGCNVLFNDVHVKFVKSEDIALLKWTAEQKE